MPKSRTKIIPAQPTRDGLSIRIDMASGARIGPGKVAVLEEIERTGSISAAGRAMAMSYRRTWLLVEEMNLSLGEAGGQRGRRHTGGAQQAAPRDGAGTMGGGRMDGEHGLTLETGNGQGCRVLLGGNCRGGLRTGVATGAIQPGGQALDLV